MIRKHFTRRLTLASFLAFLSLVFASFSCQDHEVPEQPQQPELATIKTVSAVYGGATNIFSYTVQFENLGNVPIIEYGIVSYAGETDESHVPDVPAAPYVFPFYERQYAFAMPATLNAATIARAYDQKSNTPTRLFYRAYAIHSNNAVVYGEVKFIDFLKNQDAIIKPVIQTLDASKGDDSDFIAYSLKFDAIGNIPVTEYGIVIYQGKPNEQQTPEVPTNDPLEKKYPYAEAVNLDVKNIIKQYDGPTDGPIRLFYRAYATLNNGDVVYGEVKFLDFEIVVKPVINTLNADVSPDGPNNFNITFQIQFANLGNNPIYEYGIVSDYGQPGESKYPDFPIAGIEDRFIIDSSFDTSIPLNINLEIKTRDRSFAKSPTTYRHFYRAYVKFGNNQYVYGETKFIDFIAP
ncbi:hypothetical protein [Dyadobacter bucti]|uniref:hypothetical protein n=1 Tax=Dyadobacter bucti TaxID=2572203 RepID=UPI001107E5E7|nr:hypothetical protein [Dyadobacter bucti]